MYFFYEGNYKVTPQYLTKKVGETAVFTCTVHDDVVWTFNGNSLPPNAVSNRIPNSDHTMLSIINVDLNNMGSYLCTGIHHESSSEGKGVLYVTSE